MFRNEITTYRDNYRVNGGGVHSPGSQPADLTAPDGNSSPRNQTGPMSGNKTGTPLWAQGATGSFRRPADCGNYSPEEEKALWKTADELLVSTELELVGRTVSNHGRRYHGDRPLPARCHRNGMRRHDRRDAESEAAGD